MKRRISKATKIQVLIISTGILISDYYGYDLPQAIRGDLKKEFEGKISNEDFPTLFNMLYLVYNVPNIIVPFINGFITDKVALILNIDWPQENANLFICHYILWNCNY